MRKLSMLALLAAAIALGATVPALADNSVSTTLNAQPDPGVPNWASGSAIVTVRMVRALGGWRRAGWPVKAC